MSKPNYNSRRIRQYLLNEMAEDERESFEEMLLSDDDLFYEVEDAENALVDSYVRGELQTEDSRLFERSLESIPARRSQVGNAAALQKLIADERGHEETATTFEKAGLFDTLLAVFRLPIVGYSMAGLLMMVSLAALVLLLENRRIKGDISRIRSESDNTNPSIGSDLERQLAQSRKRETEMQTLIDNERTVAGDLTGDLERERENRIRLESEVADLRKQRSDKQLPAQQDAAEPPTIAAVTLRPVGSRGLGGETVAMDQQNKVMRVAVLLALPTDIEDEERLFVQLKGRTIAENLKVRTGPNGAKTVALTVARADLTIGTNKLTISNGQGQIGEYDLTLSKE